jgi:hypothetical protein
MKNKNNKDNFTLTNLSLKGMDSIRRSISSCIHSYQQSLFYANTEESIFFNNEIKCLKELQDKVTSQYMDQNYSIPVKQKSKSAKKNT